MILRKVDYRTQKYVAEEPTNQNTIFQAIRVQSNEPMDTKRRSHKRKRSSECFLFRSTPLITIPTASLAEISL